jgi:DNA-binding NtrC family response regulator
MKVLVIDDELVVCKSCERILRRAGHEAGYRLSGREAIEAMGDTEYDIVITDLKMMDIGGMEVLQYVRERYPLTVVIIITGYATVAAAVETMKLGAFDFLPKPFTPDEFMGVLRKAVEKRNYLLEKRRLAEGREEAIGAFEGIVGKSENMQEVFQLVEKVAPTNSTVLIVGESGTGKELVARAIHERSPRSGKRFVAVDSGTLMSSLAESELFGHVRGSFTGAVADKPGLFEVADGGTMFLDEIANTSLEIQGKLLRVLQEREFLPVGGTKLKRVDVRLVFATNRDLTELVEGGTFREDLYYRLHVFPIHLPALRERREDIPALAYHFLRSYCKQTGKKVARISDDAMRLLMDFEWRGNVRQLENVIARMVILTEGDTIDANALSRTLYGEAVRQTMGVPQTSEDLKRIKKDLRERAIEEIEKQFLLDALARNGWNVTKASAEVGMQRPNFQALMRKYGISAREKSD